MTIMQTVAPDNWQTLGVAKLRELCRTSGLKAMGGRAELVKRLDVLYNGSSSEHRNGLVRCPWCMEQAKVIATRRLGATTERRYRCTGRNRHTFTIQE